MTFHEFIACRRAEHPLEPPDDEAGRQRGRILADVYEDWVHANAERFAPVRKRGLFGGGRVYQCLYETDPACLLELRSREAAIPDGIVMATVEEIQAWRDDRPDGLEGLYPIISSFFTAGLPTALHRKATARYPLRPGEEHFLHVRTAWSNPTSGVGSDDLWKSTPSGMVLLEPRWTRWRR